MTMMSSNDAVRFDNPAVLRHCERVAVLMTSLPEELRLVCGLLDAYTWFRLAEGEDAPSVRSILQCLTSAELRPALRRWYAEHGRNMNPAAREFHDVLERATGEALTMGENKA